MKENASLMGIVLGYGLKTKYLVYKILVTVSTIFVVLYGVNSVVSTLLTGTEFVVVGVVAAVLTYVFGSVWIMIPLLEADRDRSKKERGSRDKEREQVRWEER